MTVDSTYPVEGRREERVRLRRSVVTCVVLVAGTWVLARYGPTSQAQDQSLRGLRTVFVAILVALVMVDVERRAQHWPERGRAWDAVRMAYAKFVSLVFIGSLIVLACWAWRSVHGGLEPLDRTTDLLAVTALLSAGGALLPMRIPADTPGSLGQAPHEPRLPQDPVVVACSGGGIRAAAFALGGLNAIAEDTCLSRTPEPGPLLVGVSGGSYTAAAMALLRRHSARDTRTDPPSWRDAYALTSPELHRLRRHTRDLFEPRRELLATFCQWLAGLAVNTTILLGVAALLAWLTAVIADISGSLGYAGGRLRLELPGPVWGALLVVAVLLTVMTLFAWVLQTRRDAPADPDEAKVPYRHAISRRVEQLGLGLIAVTTAALVPLALLPSAAAGASALAENNLPTAFVARLVHDGGLATDEQCRRAAGESAAHAAAAAAADAALSPGTTTSYDVGACGYTTVVALTSRDDGQVCLGGSPPRCTSPHWRSWTTLGQEAYDRASSSDRSGAASRLTVLATLVTALVGVLRGGVETPTELKTGVVARVRKALFTWIPLTVFTIAVLWFVLLLVMRDVTQPTRTQEPWHYALPLAGLAAAIWVDANVTSLHAFYRRRLSNQFAAVRQSDGPAEVIDPDIYLRFSSLNSSDLPGETIPLSIATTANVRAYDQTPTRRGGSPLVFTPSVVSMPLPDSQPLRCSTQAYERFAGIGRTSIMSVVAMSGAAISPMAGRFSASLAPFRLMLTLLNVRVGVWVRNPLWLDATSSHATTIPGFLMRWPKAPWLDTRPGIAQVLGEATGRCSLTDRWLYLTDGGHLDNTGLVEAVRTLCTPGAPPLAGTVIVLDASNDREGTWAAVGEALSVVASDLGIVFSAGPPVSFAAAADATQSQQTPALVRLTVRRTTAAAPARAFARLYHEPTRAIRLLVVKAVRPADAASDDDLPDAVRSFALTHPDFPRAATTRQDFGDLEFEAYRQLGWWCTQQGLNDLSGHSAPDGIDPRGPSSAPASDPERVAEASSEGG